MKGEQQYCQAMGELTFDQVLGIRPWIDMLAVCCEILYHFGDHQLLLDPQDSANDIPHRLLNKRVRLHSPIAEVACRCHHQFENGEGFVARIVGLAGDGQILKQESGFSLRFVKQTHPKEKDE